MPSGITSADDHGDDGENDNYEDGDRQCLTENMIQVANPDDTRAQGLERCRYISASSTSEGEETMLMQATTITAEDLEIASSSANSTSAVKHFYFYQGKYSLNISCTLWIK